MRLLRSRARAVLAMIVAGLVFSLLLLAPVNALSVLLSIGLTALLTWLLMQRRLRGRLVGIGSLLGLSLEKINLDSQCQELARELTRREQVWGLAFHERRITSRHDLARVLEQLAAAVYELVQADGVEISLLSSGVATAIALGTPRQQSTPTIEEPLVFAGEVLGSLIVTLPKDRQSVHSDRTIIRLAALQASLAVSNSSFHEELLRMKRATQESQQAKTGFLANLSHEIRAPLGVMINAVEVVADGLYGTVTPEQQETLAMVKKQGDHLLDLVNDVLDYAKVESGKLKPEPEDIPVQELLEDIIGVMRKNAEAKGHSLALLSPKEAGNKPPLAIRCDRRHVRQILINLCSNAIKYTPEGGSITLAAERHPAGKVKLIVADTGVGIPAEARSKVFAPFERISDPYSSRQKGAGLGLSLTKRLAESNGGTIDFSSQSGQGSRFWVLLPSVVIDRVQSTEPTSLHRLRGQGERIALIQRHDIERDVMKRGLDHAGFSVVAMPPESHLQREVSDTIEAVIIDEDVGELIAELVHRLGGTAPVIVLSSRAFSFEAEAALREGIDRYITKPVTFEELAEAVKNVIATHRKLRRSSSDELPDKQMH